MWFDVDTSALVGQSVDDPGPGARPGDGPCGHQRVQGVVSNRLRQVVTLEHRRQVDTWSPIRAPTVGLADPWVKTPYGRLSTSHSEPSAPGTQVTRRRSDARPLKAIRGAAGQVGVLKSVGPHVLELVVGELAADLAGHACHQRPGRDDGALERRQRRRQPGSRCRCALVHEDGAHADQDVGLDGAAVQHSQVTDADAVADRQRGPGSACRTQLSWMLCPGRSGWTRCRHVPPRRTRRRCRRRSRRRRGRSRCPRPRHRPPRSGSCRRRS